MLGEQPDLARQWRLGTREIFQTYFGRGYRAVDFFLAREHGRGQYLLARAAS
jgi:predicted GNAT superfamily acetyltransferase